jgi:hypothetical protein
MRALAIAVVLVLSMLGPAHADRRASLDPRIALAVERDNLMPPTDASVVAPVVAPGARLWQTVDVVTLVLSTAALTVDWRQTRDAAREGWSGGRWEGGYPAQMAIGAHPSTRTVDGYFALTAAANVALWAVLPPRWRSVVPGFVLSVEVVTVGGNLSTTHL